MMNQCMASMNTNTTKKTNTTKEKAKSSVFTTHLSKTRMCKFNLLGTCSMGSNCGFAHSEEELKPLPDLWRTSLCPVLFQTGQCNAKNCTYAHSKDELVTGSCHKTKFCRFEQLGKCNLGNKCQFAHSADELRKPARVPGKLQQQEQQYNELRKPARVTGKPQQQDQQYNYYVNSMAIPAIFVTPPTQAPYPVTPQRLITNRPEVLTSAYEVPICAYDLSGTQKDTCSPFNLALQQPKDDSSQEGQEWDLPDKMELTRGTSTSTQDSDGCKSFSTSSDSSESEMEAAPHDRYTGAVEIMQAPLADETPATLLDDNEEDDIWRAFAASTDYQVKNTFISIKDEPTNYPLRCVRSAAGRLTEIENPY